MNYSFKFYYKSSTPAKIPNLLLISELLEYQKNNHDPKAKTGFIEIRGTAKNQPVKISNEYIFPISTPEDQFISEYYDSLIKLNPEIDLADGFYKSELKPISTNTKKPTLILAGIVILAGIAILSLKK